MRGRKEGRARQKETEEKSPGKCSRWALQMGADAAVGMQRGPEVLLCPLPPGLQRHRPQHPRRQLAGATTGTPSSGDRGCPLLPLTWGFITACPPGYMGTWAAGWAGLSSAWSLAAGILQAGLVGAQPGGAEGMLVELAADGLRRRAEVLGTAQFSNKETF